MKLRKLTKSNKLINHLSDVFYNISDYALLDSLFNTKFDILIQKANHNVPAFNAISEHLIQYLDGISHDAFHRNLFPAFAKYTPSLKKRLKFAKNNLLEKCQKSSSSIHYSSYTTNIRNVNSNYNSLSINKYIKREIGITDVYSVSITRYIISNTCLILLNQEGFSENITSPLFLAGFVYPIEYSYYLKMCMLLDEEPKASIIQLWIRDDIQEITEKIRLSYAWIRKRYVSVALKEGIPIVKKSEKELKEMVFFKENLIEEIEKKKHRVFSEFKEFLKQEPQVNVQQ